MHNTPRFVLRSREVAVFTAYLAMSLLVVLLMLSAPTTVLMIAAGLGLAVMVKYLGPSIVSPAIIVGAGLAIIAVAGRIFYPLVVRAPGAAGIGLPASPDLLNPAFMAIAMASFGLSVGATFAALLARRPPVSRTRFRPHIPRVLRMLLTVCMPLLFVTLIALTGVGTLIERDQYLVGGVGILGVAAVLALVVLGYLANTQHGLGLLVVFASIALAVLYFAANGTRVFAAAPALLALGYFMARWDRSARILLGLALVAALLLLPVPLYWRTLNSHGLIAYWESLGGYPDSGIGIASAAKTVLISLPIIGTTALYKMPEGSLFTALDPRTGEAAGWYDIASQMRLNPFTPMSGIGELAAHGTGYLITFFVVAGFYLGFLDRHVRRVIARGQHLLVFAHVGFAALFLVYVIQYNLRSSTRMLYYSAALWVVYAAWRALTQKPRKPKKAKNPERDNVVAMGSPGPIVVDNLPRLPVAVNHRNGFDLGLSDPRGRQLQGGLSSE